MDLENTGANGAHVRVELVAQPQFSWKKAIGGAWAPSGRSTTLWVRLHRDVDGDASYLDQYFGPDLHAVHGAGQVGPRWRRVNLSKVQEVSIRIDAHGPTSLRLANPRGAGEFEPPSQEQLRDSYFPCVDEYGQFRHLDWPEKVGGLADLQAIAEEDARDVASHPAPADRSAFGGWAGGPQQEATGHFRTTEFNGRWWLVDPEGHLFWSFGPNGVTFRTGRTALAREGRPHADDPRWVPGAKELRGPRWWNPLAYNLHRREGKPWRIAWVEQQPPRLWSWGFNTVANWSDKQLTKEGGVPYVQEVHYQRPSLGAAEHSTRATVPDVYHPEFFELTVEAVRRAMLGREEDPYCMGLFVDNEIPVNSAIAPAELALQSPAGTPAKAALTEFLKAVYPSIAEFNQAWRTDFTDWQAVESRQGVPSNPARAYYRDCARYSDQFLDRYYALCAQAVRTAAPKKLYLGSRINHFRNENLIKAAAAHCDVVSVNTYVFSVSEIPLPTGFDKPLIIGEFNFGAPARGVPSATSTGCPTVEEAALAMGWFVRGALEHRSIVGVHWFTYYDQPVMGRVDGENGRIGFVDVTDRPYAPMVAMSRKVGASIYETRYENGQVRRTPTASQNELSRRSRKRPPSEEKGDLR